jgi:hypothetical protein
MASACDALGKDFGEAEVVGEEASGALRRVADKAVSSAGDCCTPLTKM